DVGEGAAVAAGRAGEVERRRLSRGVQGRPTRAAAAADPHAGALGAGEQVARPRRAGDGKPVRDQLLHAAETLAIAARTRTEFARRQRPPGRRLRATRPNSRWLADRATDAGRRRR